MSNGKKLKCGIIMPISKIASNPEQYSEKHWNDVKKMISTAIEETTLFEAIPVWENNSSDQIKDTIFRNIISVDMAVCDISALNANVLFELGLRLSLRKPVVIICDDKTVPPFDINDIRYVDPKYPVGLNMYEIPDYQKNLCDVIKKTWERYTSEGVSFSQLAQLKLSPKAIIVDGAGETIKDSDAIAEILEKLTSISKNMSEKSANKTSNNGTEILQVREDIESFKNTVYSFIEKIKRAVTEDDLGDFEVNVHVHFEDLEKFINNIEEKYNNG